MDSGTLDDSDNNEHIGVRFVEISKILFTQDAFFPWNGVMWQSLPCQNLFSIEAWLFAISTYIEFIQLIKNMFWKHHLYSHHIVYIHGLLHEDITFLFHDQNTILAEKGCVEKCDFHMAALMFLTGHGIKARMHAHAEIAHFPTRCIIRAWEALGLQRCASQVLMMHLIWKCAISTRAWVLAILNVQ